MKRIAILVEKNLTSGAAANTAAVLMGQAALLQPHIYDTEPVADAEGHRHAGIRYSTIVLEAGAGQLANLAQKVNSDHQNVICVIFSQIGQGLHNAFEGYRERIAASNMENAKPVGLILTGEDHEIRALTKKFSILK